MGIVTVGVLILFLATLMSPLANQTTGQTLATSTKTSQGDYPLKSLACCAPSITWNTGGGIGPTTVGNCFTVTGTGTLTRLDFYLSNPGHVVTGQIVGQIYSTLGTIANGHCASQASFVANSTNLISAASLSTNNPVTTGDLQEFTFSQAISTGNYVAAFRIAATQGPNQLLYTGSNIPADTSIAEVDNSGTNPRGNLNQAGNDITQTACAGFNFCIAFAAYSTIAGGNIPNQNVTLTPGLVPIVQLLPFAFATFGLLVIWVRERENHGGV